MGEKKYKKLLAKKGFRLNSKVYKNGKKDLVLGCYRGNEFVVKIFFPLRSSCPLEQYIMQTEIQALRFLDGLNLPFFPKYIDHTIHRKCHLVVMEKIIGKLLLSFSRRHMSMLFWKSLIYQLIVIVFILEDQAVVHHDFLPRNIILHPHQNKDANIVVHYKNHVFNIPNAGFIVKTFDFQFMHHYDVKSMITCQYAITKKYSKYKSHLGIASNFNTGTDLNLIFGALLRFTYLPNNVKRVLNSLVAININNKQNRQYALLLGNPKTAAAVLLAKFDQLFRFT